MNSVSGFVPGVLCVESEWQNDMEVIGHWIKSNMVSDGKNDIYLLLY